MRSLPPASIPAELTPSPRSRNDYAAHLATLQAYVPRIQGILRKYIYNESDIQELSQDVVLRALEKLPSFRGEASLNTWLHRIATNTALMFRRRKKMQNRIEEKKPIEELLETHAPSNPSRQSLTPDDITSRKATTLALRRAVQNLPEKYRNVVILADMEDMPNEDVARKLKLSLPAVKSRLHRARKMIRDQIINHVDPEDGVV
ncbi:MAG TPA: sigma-70 family RNA polymerase sigma factor [Gemmatales bacterium]|nr:sigma-70 family RNA polymerase sigma factor [Gemmatales bacterium]